MKLNKEFCRYSSWKGRNILFFFTVWGGLITGHCCELGVWHPRQKRISSWLIIYSHTSVWQVWFKLQTVLKGGLGLRLLGDFMTNLSQRNSLSIYIFFLCMCFYDWMDWNWPSLLVWFGSCGTRYHGFGLVDNLSVNYNLSYGWKWWHCRDRILRPPPLSSLPFFTLILLSIVFLHKISSYEGGNLHSNINCVLIIHVKHGCSPLALSHTYIHTHTDVLSLSFLFLPSPPYFPLSPPPPHPSPPLSLSLFHFQTSYLRWASSTKESGTKELRAFTSMISASSSWI